MNAIKTIEGLRMDGKMPADAAEMAVRAVNRFSNVDSALRAVRNWMAHKGMEVPGELLNGFSSVNTATMVAVAGG